MVYLHSGILRSRRKERVPTLRHKMELESIMLSEISQVVKDKTVDLTYKWNLINKTSKLH